MIRVMKRIIKEAKVTAIHFHDMRHTHTYILIAEGVDIVKIAADKWRTLGKKSNKKRPLSTRPESLFYGRTFVPKGFLRVWHPMVPTGLEPATPTLSR